MVHIYEKWWLNNWKSEMRLGLGSMVNKKLNSLAIFFMSLPFYTHTHPHTHTHIYVYWRIVMSNWCAQGTWCNEDISKVPWSMCDYHVLFFFWSIWFAFDFYGILYSLLSFLSFLWTKSHFKYVFIVTHCFAFESNHASFLFERFTFLFEWIFWKLGLKIASICIQWFRL